MPKIELHFSALPVNVRTARLVAASLGRRVGLDAVVIDEIKLAVGEACSRAVIVHAGAAAPIVVEFHDDDDLLEISVKDCGPVGARLPDAETAEAPYIGAHVVDSYVDTDSDQDSREDGASLTPALCLAMLAGLVDDVSVDDRSESRGSVVTMRWPIVSF